MAKNNQLTTQIIITCNAKNADDEIKRIQATVTQLDNKIKKMKEDSADPKDIKFVENLRNAMNNFSRETVTGFDRIKAAIDNLDAQSINQLRRARRAAQQYRDSLSANDAEYAQAEANLKKINTQIDLLTGKQRRLSEATKNFNGTLQNLSTASIDKLNEALKDGEVMLNRMSKDEVERAGVVPGMANIRQEIANRRISTVGQMRDSVSKIAMDQGMLEHASPAELTAQISVAKNALDQIPGSLEKTRKFFIDAIGTMQSQLQKLNGTFVDTDEFINKTFADMQKKSASPKQLAEAIGYIKQKLDELPLSEKKQRAQYEKMMEKMLAQTKQVKGELVTVKQLKEAVASISDDPQSLEHASPERITEQIANARKALSQLPATSVEMRRFFSEAIQTMQAQLQKLNGTLVNTDEVIKKTFSDMQSKAASPKQLAEAIGYIKQKLDELPASEESQRASYKQMMDEMVAETKRLSGELKSLEEVKSSMGDFLLDNLQTASPAQLKENIALAKNTLDRLPGNAESDRQLFSSAIQHMEERLQALNGTLVNTDEVINKTMADMQKGAVTPKQLTESIGLVKQKLDSLPASAETERQKYNKMLAEMIQKNKQLRGELTLTEKELADIRAIIQKGGIKTLPFDQLREAAKMMRLELSKISESDVKFKTLQRDIDKVEAQLNKTTNAVNKHGSAWKTTNKNMMAYVGVFGMLNMVKSKIEEIVSLNLKFSQQLADVRKVSGLASKDIKDLGNQLAKIDSRTSLQGLMDTAYSGAKLGFGEQGVDGLVQFTKAANVASVAIGEELGEDALPALSKIVENMGIIKKYGIEQSMLKTASAMFKLSSTSTATSNNIVEFAKRLTAMSKVAGITTDQLLALGSASDAMYLSPEVAATAFTKMLSSLQTNHNLIEKTLNMTKGSINEMFSKGKAMDAIVTIFERMNKMGNMNALQPIFKDLGSEGGARLMNVMTAMAKNVTTLEKHLRTSAEAFKEGTAATMEYNIQQETAEGLMERAKNLWKKAVMNPEEVDVVHEFAKAWYDVSKSVTTSQFAMWNIKTAISSLMWILKSFLQLLPSIIVGLGAAGLYRTIIGLATGFRVLIAACRHFTFVWKMMSIATQTGWIGVAATAITALASVFGSWYVSATRVKAALDDVNKSVSDSIVAGRKATLEVDNYVRAINKAAIGTNERAVAIKKFNEKFGAYYSNMLTEKSTANDIARAYAEVVKHLKEKMLYEGMQKDYEVSVGNRQVSSLYRLQEYDDAYKKTGRTSLHDADWLEAKVKDMRNAGYGSVKNIFNAIIGSAIPTPGFGKSIISLAKSGETPSSLSQGWSETDSNFNDRKAGLALYRYIAQEVAKWDNENKFKKRWSRKQGEINDWLNFSANAGKEEPGTLDNDATDKDAKKAAAAAERERKRLAREHKDKLQKDLKAADGQVKSFTKAIDAYYTLQEKAIQELYMQGKMNEAEMNRYITLMKSRHDIIAAQGRFAIVGDENNFDELRKQMGADFDQFDYSSESNKLLGIIQNADPTATGKLIRNLESALGTTPDNSIMNDVRNNAVNSQKSESDRRLKLFEAADSYLNSKNYIVNVGREYDTILSQSGLTDVGLERGSTVASGKEPPARTKVVKNPETGKEEPVVMGEPTATMRQDFVKEGVSHYDVDVNDAVQLREWLNRFVSVSGKGILQKDGFGTQFVHASDKKDWANYIPGLEDMLYNVGEDADEKIKILFSTLMQYEAKYYEAKKQQLDYETKILESRWTRSDDYKQGQEKERELDVKSHIQGIYGRGESEAFLNTQEMARNNGFADNIEGDPEVEKVKLHMELARKEAALAQQTSDDKELIRQKDRAAQDAELAYADKINSQIKARIDLLQQWVDPLQEFSEAMGDAFVKMTDSAEEGRDAMKQATENMVKTFAKMTINMIAQQLKMEVQRALFHKRMQRSETDYMEGMKDANEKGHKSIFKALGSFFKKKKKDTAKNQKDENKEKNKAAKEQGNIVKESADTELKAKTDVATKGMQITQKMDQQTSETKVQTAATDAQTTATETQGNIFAGIASGAAKIIGKLGWWGIPLIAVIQGLLMGLLNSALGKLFGGKNKSSSNTNTKLVSGMLTYDSGNVEAFSGAIDKKTYPVVGNDGKVYAAKPTDKLVTGLLTEPVATTINGVPSLVAERGPEMIIGRETTQALMMARPDIISEIVRFDRNHSGRTYRAYDGGNISEVVGNLSTPLVSSPQQQVTQTELADFVSTMQAMTPVMQAFIRQLQQPLKTSINMYGNGGLYDSVNRASKFMRGRS